MTFNFTIIKGYLYVSIEHMGRTIDGWVHFQANGLGAVWDTPCVSVEGRSDLGIKLICKQFERNYL